MAIVEVEFRSEALGHDVSYSMILPEVGTGPYPVLIQLHGLGDNHRAWIEKSMLAIHVRDLPLAVVMPGTGTDSYINWRSAERLHQHFYETYIAKDLVDHVKRHFNVTDGPWAIGGLSMGGYGAMRLGLKYHDMFASIWSHSSAFMIPDRIPEDLVDEGQIEDASVFEQASRLKRTGAQLPLISFDCGVDDRLIDTNREFDEHLARLGLAHHYAEHPGDHTWEYWNEHVQEALVQHSRALGIQPIRTEG
jgi:S-formylglutathione hydrolase FrmB